VSTSGASHRARLVTVPALSAFLIGLMAVPRLNRSTATVARRFGKPRPNVVGILEASLEGDELAAPLRIHGGKGPGRSQGPQPPWRAGLVTRACAVTVRMGTNRGKTGRSTRIVRAPRPPILFLSVLLTLASACGSTTASTGQRVGSAARAMPGAFCNRSTASAPIPSRSGEARRSGVSLQADRSIFAPGQDLYVRIYNRRARSIAFGFDPRVEVFWKHRWRRLPIEENGIPVAFAGPGIVLTGAPVVSGCQRIPLAPDWAAGRYRVRQKVRARYRGGRVRSLDLTAAFELERAR
jgi:hypothetical protein